jgi:dolichol kinase
LRERGATRRVVHFGVLGLVALLPVLGPNGMAAVAGAAFLANLLVLPRTPLGRALAREGEGRWNGLVAYPAAVAAGFLLFGPAAAAAGWAVMACGDPAASTVGRARPWKARIPWCPARSLAGSLAFVVAAAAGAALVAAGLPAGGAAGAMRGAAAIPWGAVAAAAVAGALAESLPWPADDNLPVLLAAGCAWTGVAAAGGHG